MSTPLPHRPSAFQSLPGRLARPSIHRAATRLDHCDSGINPPWSPAPPHGAMEPPAGARPAGKGAGRIAFCNGGMGRYAEKPVDSGLCYLASQGSTKASAAFARFKLPRVWPFLPRVGLFLPRAHFSAEGPLSLSFFHFSEERKRKRGAEAAGSRSTGLRITKMVHPRVGPSIHGFPVDEKIGKSQHWRGFAADRASIHASTGCFAPGLPQLGQAGGVRG